MNSVWVGNRVWLLLCACLCLSLQPAQATPPERGEAVPNECTQAYPFIAGHPPPEDLVDPGSWIVGCNGVMIPTSLVGYYVSLDSWKSVAVAENEHLEVSGAYGLVNVVLSLGVGSRWFDCWLFGRRFSVPSCALTAHPGHSHMPLRITAVGIPQPYTEQN